MTFRCDGVRGSVTFRCNGVRGSVTFRCDGVLGRVTALGLASSSHQRAGGQMWRKQRCAGHVVSWSLPAGFLPSRCGLFSSCSPECLLPLAVLGARQGAAQEATPNGTRARGQTGVLAGRTRGGRSRTCPASTSRPTCTRRCLPQSSSTRWGASFVCIQPFNLASLVFCFCMM